MENLNIDDMLKVMSDPKVGSNIDSIMEAMDEAQKIMGKFEKLMSSMDRMGIKNGIMRLIGKKYEVDVDSPLGCENPGIVPASAYHEMVLKEMNQLSEIQIAQLLKSGAESVEKPKPVELDDETINQPTE